MLVLGIIAIASLIGFGSLQIYEGYQVVKNGLEGDDEFDPNED